MISFQQFALDSERDLLVDLTVNLPYILIWAAILGGAVLAVRAMVRRAVRRRANKAQPKPQDPEA